MTPDQREKLIHLLQAGEEISPEWARVMFPPEKREYELVYHGKEREEDIIANTIAVPLQPVRSFNGQSEGWHNKLIFGDNLQTMKRLLEMKKAGELCNADGSPGVRLVYIDPPFATMKEFHGSEDQKAYQDKIIGAQFIEFMRKRLILLRELLADDGAIYVHLDWKKVHYIKVVMDEVFGQNNFRNDITWHYPGREMHISSKFNAKHDTLLFYAKSPMTRIRMDQVVIPYDRDERLKGLRRKVHTDEDGREWVWETRGQAAGQEAYKRYVDDIVEQGKPLSDVWSDLQFLRGNHPERTGYPTQKPAALVERVVKASSALGDIVLDAFAGSGTTCAVAEKLGRRWIGIDCGKLAVYTIQKRLLNLKEEVGGEKFSTAPYTLYNAGLYDFSRLRELPWEEWRRFALTLFGCREEKHTRGGIQFDGTLKACPVQVFDYRQHGGAMVTEETLGSIHEAAGSRIGSRMFIIAPALAFDFQQDYIQLGDVRYYALRIPYSIIHELHQKDFMALKQPIDELAVNDTVDAVGFDFIRTPDLEYKTGRCRRSGELLEEAFISIERFHSEAVVREPVKKRGNRETLSMVMLDYDYNVEEDVFSLDDVFYAGEIEAANWRVQFPVERLGQRVMAVFVDIYGNEARVLIPAGEFAATERPSRARKGRAVKAVQQDAVRKS
ncbi:site-specific DNA-methyltransferase [Roseicella aquatilis]|uniref:site-specific DNA-methyltransferase (adenine-specific) n=1 Tax=Roseicella aquatilis TaxID=2527868 RepID=A0A4R4D2X2_9PROT|nr:site-specific DNA-methyltransferase [Roseicella aquatilis]TCZ51917.1 site-specific DNA-methyltransferase [Roseicella aquatilis]